MVYKNDHAAMGNNYGDEYSYDVTDTERVKNIIKQANG